VHPTGNDSNDGLSTGGSNAFATIQNAVDTIFFALDNNNTGPVISLADGTYTESVVLVRGCVLGYHCIAITGNTGNPANVIWQAGASGYCLGITVPVSGSLTSTDAFVKMPGGVISIDTTMTFSGAGAGPVRQERSSPSTHSTDSISTV
jgi:hypothetical protein